MTELLDFQSIIMALQNFWAKQGCLIWQPYYTQVGAGTMNPATALRVLGPEPGMWATWSHPSAPTMGAMVKTPTACRCITSSR